MTRSTFAFGDCNISISERPSTARDPRTLLFLHGRFGGAATFEPLASSLGGRFRCLAPDLPGFGRSYNVRERGLSLAELVELAIAIAEREKKVFLAGHDLGGAIAQVCAVRHPELFSGIILLNTSSPFLAPDIRYSGRAWRERLQYRDLRRVAGAKGSALPERPMGGTGVSGWLRFLRGCSDSWPGLYERQFWKKELGKLSIPALVLLGMRDPLHSVDESRELCRLLPDAELHERENCGHWPAFEDPIWVAEQIHQFVFRVEAEEGVSLFQKSLSR